MMPNSTIVSTEILPLEAQPEAWVAVGAGLSPARILAANFQGGILETEANVDVGAFIPLNVSNGTELISVHIHIVEETTGRMVFRLYGTNGLSRSLWDAFVRELRDKASAF
tara:strand:+ start:53203 stop:53535 length:333 start_codon:yes stop_codon:yes gene_type:complete